MKYEERLICHRVQDIPEYKKCIFICERPDKNSVIVQIKDKGYSLFSTYAEVDIKTLYNKEQINKLFDNNKKEYEEKIKKWESIYNNINNYCIFNKSLNILINLNEQKSIWEFNLKYSKNKKDTENATKILHQINKGIRKINKRIYTVVNKYKELELEDLHDLQTKINFYKEKIKWEEKKRQELTIYLS